MRTRAILLAAAMLLTAVPLCAQQVTLAAVVPVASPTGAGTRNLTFGIVMPVPGATQNVDVTAAVAPVSATVQSGEFRYNVASTRGLDFVMTVPAVLIGVGSPPLGVTFDGMQYGGYCVTTGGACTLTSFNPASAANTRVCAQVIGSGSCHPARVFPLGSELAIYIGGHLSVPPSTRAGVYTGTVTLTIVQVY
jgi:hypothetical protein